MLVNDEDTALPEFQKRMRWNQAQCRLAEGP